MNKVPFLYNFKQPALETEEPEAYVYDESSQLNKLSDETLVWMAAKPSTSVWTSAHHVPGHKTPSGRYISSHYVSGKTDKRAGK